MDPGTLSAGNARTKQRCGAIRRSVKGQILTPSGSSLVWKSFAFK